MSNHRTDIRRRERRRNRSKKTSRYHSKRLRMVVYRSLKHFEAQIIDDFKGQTLISSSSKDKDLNKIINKATSKIEVSKAVGVALAKKATKESINSVVFDRNGYPYHGRVKAFAEAVRESGMEL
tara:strand:+ start:342 stop:713 length:372 start_codon:yes stop_codon:yes gene_type:complete